MEAGFGALPAGWAPKPIWTISIRQKSLALIGIRIPDSPFRSIVTTAVARGSKAGKLGGKDKYLKEKSYILQSTIFKLLTRL
jgi:hypothetical protein